MLLKLCKVHPALQLPAASLGSLSNPRCTPHNFHGAEGATKGHGCTTPNIKQRMTKQICIVLLMLLVPNSDYDIARPMLTSITLLSTTTSMSKLLGRGANRGRRCRRLHSRSVAVVVVILEIVAVAVRRRC